MTGPVLDYMTLLGRSSRWAPWFISRSSTAQMTCTILDDAASSDPATANELAQDIEHINQQGSKHTGTIASNHCGDARRLLTKVDSTSVIVNSSPLFSDDFEHRPGSEIGIFTDKLNSRVTVGIEGMTIEKYVVFGDGHVRT